MIPTQIQDTLYEQDFVAWLDDTAMKLKQRQFEDINIDSLIEEIEGLARQDRRELENCLKVLLTHLLKRLYVGAVNDYRGWELTIREQRQQIQSLLKQSPSLQNYLLKMFSEIWQSALCDLREDYPKAAFSNDWQYSTEINVLLNDKFWESQD